MFEILLMILRYFRFLEGKEKDAFELFEEHCKHLYSDWMNKGRTTAMRKAKSDTMTVACKEFYPDWLTSEIWGDIVDKFFTEGYQKRQEIAHRNRAGLTILHTAGSSPYEAHADAFKRKNGRYPTIIELWTQMHTKGRDNGEWLNPIAKETVDEYSQWIGIQPTPMEGEDDMADDHMDLGVDSSNETLNAAPEMPPDDLIAWAKITRKLSKSGGLARNRVVGIGKRKSAKLFWAALLHQLLLLLNQLQAMTHHL